MDNFLEMPLYLRALICLMFAFSILPYLIFFVASLRKLVILSANKAKGFEINGFFDISKKTKTVADISNTIMFISENQKEKERMSALFDRAALWTLVSQFAITIFVINEMAEMGAPVINSFLSTRDNGAFVGIQTVQFIVLFSIYCYMFSIKKMNEAQFNYEIYSLGELETQFLSADDAKAIKNNKITGEYVQGVLNEGRKLTRMETDMLLDFIDEEESNARCGISGKIIYGE
ncbi:hypothetical protein [Aeromonas sp. MrichA-1]|uniref:hypothetical protein n=1 Tax=Aeromonas sp. MrichA-1 TaxID=2823362 RepID=UPI001B31A1A0|nr:hypothetical protein [Aeromonas sp. MrichA-1]MBP4081769.1 hypothetical protein [Aeromonas sp. MrichA-1]